MTRAGPKEKTITTVGRLDRNKNQRMLLKAFARIAETYPDYTLQIFGQEDVNPTLASLVMSLESVFSALTGWLVLGERLTPRELAGCALMFMAIILAQLDLRPLLGIKKPSP